VDDIRPEVTEINVANYSCSICYYRNFLIAVAIMHMVTHGVAAVNMTILILR
jgi:hypothetical protein